MLLPSEALATWRGIQLAVPALCRCLEGLPLCCLLLRIYVLWG